MDLAFNLWDNGQISFQTNAKRVQNIIFPDWKIWPIVVYRLKIE